MVVNRDDNTKKEEEEEASPPPRLLANFLMPHQQLESDKESICRQSGTKSPGDYKVTGETENTRDEGHTADRSQRAQQIHG